MKIIVCIKQVPDTETRIRIAPDAKGIVESDVSWVISPYDELAIEEALRIREAKGGEVVAVSVGPDRVQTALRTALAMGGDSAIHVKDAALDGADPLAIAKALAAVVKGLTPFDLVLTGQQGVGGDNSQVPGLLAELLDLPQVTVAVKLEVGEGTAKVEREVEGGREVWETSLPAVVSTQKGLNDPRSANIKGIMAAKKKAIVVMDASTLGLDASALAPKTSVVCLEMPPARSAVKMLDGDADTQVAELVRLLHEEAKVL